MKKILLFISLLCCLTSIGQRHGNRQTYWGLQRTASAQPPCPNPPCNTNFSFTDIPITTDFPRDGGNQVWNFNDGCQIVTGLPKPRSAYRRYFWSDLENSGGGYKFNGQLRDDMTTVLADTQLFAFGVGTIYPDPDLGGFSTVYNYDNAFSMYPQYIHTQMQALASNQRDFSTGVQGNSPAVWIPNYNSTAYLNGWQNLYTNLKNWFDTAIIRLFNNQGALIRAVSAMSMLQFHEARGYGSYGEWHHANLNNGFDVISNWNAQHSGCFGSVSSMKQIISTPLNAFPNLPLVCLVATMDGGWFPNDPNPGFQNTQIPAEVGIWILQTSNAAGHIGLRRDQVGNDEQYYHMILEGNNMTFGGSQPAKNYILALYQDAYFAGEPQGGPPFDCPDINMGCSPSQMRTLHMYSFGNGNYGGCSGVPNGVGTNSPDSVRTAFRLAGDRPKLASGFMTTTLQQNAQFTVSLTLQNVGLATNLRAYTTVLELRNGANQTVWTGNMTVTIRKLIGGTSSTSSNNFTLPNSVPVGTYRLVVRIIDPTGYMTPYYLGTTGRETDGAYPLRTGISVVVGT